MAPAEEQPNDSSPKIDTAALMRIGVQHLRIAISMLRPQERAALETHGCFPLPNPASAKARYLAERRLQRLLHSPYVVRLVMNESPEV